MPTTTEPPALTGICHALAIVYKQAIEDAAIDMLGWERGRLARSLSEALEPALSDPRGFRIRIAPRQETDLGDRIELRLEALCLVADPWQAEIGELVQGEKDWGSRFRLLHRMPPGRERDIVMEHRAFVPRKYQFDGEILELWERLE